jgi:ElaB/YqjD/DUF883 family membrane-anchored ribosome-binding protein
MISRTRTKNMPTARKKNGNGKRESFAGAHAVQQDLRSLRDDLSTLAEDVTSLAQESSEEALAEIKERVSRIRDNVDEFVSSASTRGRDALRDVTSDLNDTMQTSLREHPLTVLALAAGIGFIFGATWKR